jgi:hypothetical protein
MIADGMFLRWGARMFGFGVGSGSLAAPIARYVLGIAGSLAAIVLTASVSAEEPHRNVNVAVGTGKVLTFKTSIDLDSAAYNLALSPDGSAIAFVTGKLEIRVARIDSSAADIVLARREPNPVIVWSPDSKLIATNGLSGLTLYSAADGKKLASIPNDKSGCAYSPVATNDTATFTHDGRSIWVSCYVLDAGDSYLAAQKLAIPGLDREDSVTLQAPMPGRRNNVFGVQIARQPGTGNVVLSHVVRSSEWRNPMEDIKFLVCSNLSLKEACFPPIKRSDPAFSRGFTVRDSTGIAYWTTPSPLESIDLLHRSSIARFGYSGKPDDFEASPSFAVSPTGRFVYARMWKEKSLRGGIAIFDSTDGRMIHLEPLVGMSDGLALRPDGRELAVSSRGETFRDEVRIYEVSH